MATSGCWPLSVGRAQRLVVGQVGGVGPAGVRVTLLIRVEPVSPLSSGATRARVDFVQLYGALYVTSRMTPFAGPQRSPTEVRLPDGVGGDADPKTGRPAQVVGGRAVGADTADSAVDWHRDLRVIGIDRCAQQCRTAARASVTQLTHPVSACRQFRPFAATIRAR